jgi:putative DNA primase/helicase
MQDCCEVDKRNLPRESSLRCLSSRLFASWAQWTTANGEKPGTNKSFSEDMVRRGFEKRRGAGGVEFFRVSLRQPAQPYSLGAGS